jgi:prepilin-type processing-associated H-X9-DG protein
MSGTKRRVLSRLPDRHSVSLVASGHPNKVNVTMADYALSLP